MTKLRRLVGLLFVVYASAVVPAYADAVTHWNDVTLTAVTIGRPGPVGFLDIALVQAAVHDAVQAIERRFEPYYAVIPIASGSPDAAVAAAAHDVLVGLYPAQQATLDLEYSNYLAANGLLGDPGTIAGQQAAAFLRPLWRPAPALPPFVGGTEPGEWRPTPNFIGSPPPPPAPMAFLFAAFTEPFTLNRPSQFRRRSPATSIVGHMTR